MLIRQRWRTEAEHDMFAIRRKACETPSWHSPFTWRPRETENSGCPSAVTIRSATAMLTNQKLEMICRLGFVQTVPITNTLPIVPRNVDKIFTDRNPAMCPRGKRQCTVPVDPGVEEFTAKSMIAFSVTERQNTRILFFYEIRVLRSKLTLRLLPRKLNGQITNWWVLIMGVIFNKGFPFRHMRWARPLRRPIGRTEVLMTVVAGNLKSSCEYIRLAWSVPQDKL